MDELCELARGELAGITGLELRIRCNRLRKLADELDPPKPQESAPCDNLDAMSLNEEAEFGRNAIPFGRHAGLSYDEVPRDYLDWLVEEKRTEWRQLVRYLKARNRREVDD